MLDKAENMDHPDYLSPLQKFLRYIYLHTLSAAGASAEQSKWLITGTAAILGLLVANLASIHEVVSSWAIKWGILLLTISMLIGVVVVLMSIAIKQAVLVTDALYKKFAEPEGKASIEGITEKLEIIIESMIEPYYGPFKCYMRMCAYRGASDFLATEKRSVRMVCTIIYLSLAQGILGACGLIALVIGIK